MVIPLIDRLINLIWLLQIPTIERNKGSNLHVSWQILNLVYNGKAHIFIGKWSENVSVLCVWIVNNIELINKKLFEHT